MAGGHAESVISSDAGRDHMPFAAKVVGGALFVASLLAAGGGIWLVTGSGSALVPAVFVASGFFFLAAAIVPLAMAREIR